MHLQVILCGDFFQLPPVGLGKGGSGFAFSSAAWVAAGIQTVELTEPIRQGGDLDFVRVLTELRWGKCSEHAVEVSEFMMGNIAKAAILYLFDITRSSL